MKNRLFVGVILVIVLLMVSFNAFAESWYCPQCGRKNDNQFCPVDGTNNPLNSTSGSGAYTPNTPNVYAGQHILFGQYEQDNNYNNGREPIEWRVLTVTNKEALLISEYGLDCVLYHQYNDSVTWQDCTLRTWLNNSFYTSAFNSNEQTAILCNRISNDISQNASYDGKVLDGGYDTWDRVFLLSFAETQRYFSGDSERQCFATAHANANGAFKKNGYTYWYTRSPGYLLSFVTIINSEGKNHGSNTRVNNNGKNNGVVRPAIWVDVTRLP